MLRTHELSATVIFWTTVLNFECTDLSEDDGWAVIMRDGVEVMFATQNAHQPFEAPQFTGSLYFRTDDVDEIWRVAQTRAEVCYPLESFDTACASSPSTTTTAISSSSAPRSSARSRSRTGHRLHGFGKSVASDSLGSPRAATATALRDALLE